MNQGTITQIIGPVIDIRFSEGKLPALYNAVRIKNPFAAEGEDDYIIVEVAQHLGDNSVRAVAMHLPSDGSLHSDWHRSPP